MRTMPNLPHLSASCPAAVISAAFMSGSSLKGQLSLGIWAPLHSVRLICHQHSTSSKLVSGKQHMARLRDAASWNKPAGMTTWQPWRCADDIAKISLNELTAAEQLIQRRLHDDTIACDAYLRCQKSKSDNLQRQCRRKVDAARAAPQRRSPDPRQKSRIGCHSRRMSHAQTSASRCTQRCGCRLLPDTDLCNTKRPQHATQGNAK